MPCFLGLALPCLAWSNLSVPGLALPGLACLD
ncbi:hypothetical protein CP10743SC13_2281, partial [Chlamydia psittaci 10_743_SC13]